jgi:hypothetical protein
MNNSNNTPLKQSPFDLVKVQDPNNIYGRIVIRLRGYYPTHQETEAMMQGVRTMCGYLLAGASLGALSGTLVARRMKKSSFGVQAMVGVGCGLTGSYLGTVEGARQAARTVLNLPGSTIATVIREEMLELHSC